jgi:proteic killer suppression protein
MKLKFNNNTKHLNKWKEIVKKHGHENAEKINYCLLQIKAAKNFDELKAIRRFRCHQLDGELKGCYGLDIKHPLRLVIRPIDGLVDDLNSSEIEIVQIGDYHG